MYEWETGRNIPRLYKMIDIAACFGISLDCLINGKVTGGNAMETRLIQPKGTDVFEAANELGLGQLVSRFHSLPNRFKERLIGYLDSLCREV